MRYLHKVESLNRRDMRRFIPLAAGGVHYGWMTEERAGAVLAFASVFQQAGDGIILHPALKTPLARAKAIAELAPALAAAGLFPKPRGEIYAVRNLWRDRPGFTIDRALVPGFGLRAYGVHVNGVVEKKNGTHLWIGTRAKDLMVEPGKRDNMVAGGQPAKLGLMENLVKECGEEAHIKPTLARRAKPASVLSYSFESPTGLRCDTLFCYDLAMPAAVKPRPSEEIARYDLKPLATVLKEVRTASAYKLNVNMVIIDFAMRRGVITPENEPDYEKIVAGMHQRPQSPV